MIRGMTILWAVLVLLVSSAMFLMKMQVQDLEDQLASINRATRQDREDIRVLEAEWNYLNTPGRLAEQSRRLLSMEQLESNSIVALADVPMRGADPSALVRYNSQHATPRSRAMQISSPLQQADLGGLEGDQ